MIAEAIQLAIKGKDLEYGAARQAMEEIMEGKASQVQIASFLTALRMKGESIGEITACATVMREKAVAMEPVGEVMDIVGTGGDEAGTFNISTTTAFVVSARGIPVAKHGNRSVSSRSGAADVLEKLGVNILISPERCLQILKEIDLCFMFAQLYHQSMKHAAPVRKELGVRTIFNVLGPLANPAGASLQLMGVFDEKLVEPMGQVLINLGVRRGMVIHGMDGLDEATLSAETRIAEICQGELSLYTLKPEDFGLLRCNREDLQGGDPAENAAITQRILSGAERGPKRDVVVLNAALALYLGGGSPSIQEGLKMAESLIDSGSALTKLEDLIRLSNEVPS